MDKAASQSTLPPNNIAVELICLSDVNQSKNSSFKKKSFSFFSPACLLESSRIAHLIPVCYIAVGV